MKKILSAILFVTLTIGMLSGIQCFAEGRQGIFWFDRCFEDTYTIDMNFKKTMSGASYGFEITAPLDESDLKSFAKGKYTANAMIRFTKDGEIAFRNNPGFITPEKEYDTGLIKIPIELNRVYNLKMKFFTEAKKVEYYLDGKKIHEAVCNIDLPCNGISFFAESNEVSGFEWEVVSVMGNNYGEFSGAISEVDEENKTIDIAFSEKVDYYSFAGEMVLKNTNGGEESPLFVEHTGISSVKLGYDAQLDIATEYAVVFPEGVRSESGSVLKNRFCYFTSKSDTVEVSDVLCDYNNGVASVWMNGIMVEDTDSEHGKSLVLKKVSDSGKKDELLWNGFTFPDKEKASVKFQIMPLYDDLQFSIRFMDAINENGIVPINIALGKGGYILGGRHWFPENMTNVDTPNESYKIGDYEASKWYNFELKYDRKASSADVYINGKLVKTLDSSVLQGYNGIGRVKFTVHGDKMLKEKGTKLLYFDNVETSYQKASLSVKKIRAVDIYDIEKGAFETISRAVKGLYLYFDGEVSEPTVNEETVKLYYDGVDIPYDGLYDANEKCYAIYPHNIPDKNANIGIFVNGVANEDSSSVVSYETYLYAENTDDEFLILKNVILDEQSKIVTEISSGFVYSGSTIVNMTDNDREVVISVMGYKDNALKEYDAKKVTVNADSIYESAPGIDVIFIESIDTEKIVAAIENENYSPMIEAYVVGQKNDEDGQFEILGSVDKTNAGKAVSLYVYAPERDFDDIENTSDFRDVLIYKNQIVIGENGEYSDKFNIDYPDARSGEYIIKVFGDGVYNEKSLFYCNPVQTKTVFETVLVPALANEDLTAIKAMICDNYADFGVNVKYVDEDVALVAAKLLINKNKESVITLEQVKEIVNIAVGIGALENQKITDVLAEEKMFCLKDSKLNGYYNSDYVSDLIRKNTVNRLQGKAYETIEDFYNALYEAFTLSVIENPLEPNSIVKVLNAFYIVAEYEKSYLDIWGKRYNSLAEVKKILKEADLKHSSNSSGSSGNSGGGGGGGGNTSVNKGNGASDSGNLIMTVPMEQEASGDKAKAVFVDIYTVPWAEEAILELNQKGIVNGKSSGYFCPDDSVTREEFTKLLVSAFELKHSGEEINFSDVIKSEWYSEHIKIAYSNGIILGVGDNRFGVGEKITRQDMAVMLSRVVRMTGKQVITNDTGIKFSDHSFISDYAIDSVYFMRNAGVINGTGDNCFAPKSYATRAEAVKMIYEIIK